MKNLFPDLLVKFWTIGIIEILVVFSPGPDFALIIKNNLIYSKRTAFATLFGILTSTTIHIIYNILGLGYVISTNKSLLKIITILGGSYLIFLGIKSTINFFRNYKKSAFKKNDDYDDLKPISNFAAFKMGFLCNILNPKAILFFISLFSTVIDPKTSIFVLILLSLELIIVSFICFCIVIVGFSKEKVRKFFYKYRFLIELLTGIFFIFVGLKLILDHIS